MLNILLSNLHAQIYNYFPVCCNFIGHNRLFLDNYYYLCIEQERKCLTFNINNYYIMKNFTNMKFALLLAVVLAMVGCAKEQSSMEAGSMPNRAKIVGSYSYDEGQDFVNGNYVCLIKPAADVKVEIRIDADEYSDNASDGVITYYTHTDKDGRFEISIPVPSDGVTARVKPVDFVGTYTAVEDIDNGEPVYVEKEVVFSATEAHIDLMPNDIEIHDGIYYHNERNIEEGYDYTSEYDVLVGKATYSVGRNEENEDVILQEYKVAKGVDVIISVTYENDKTLKYVAKTNSFGVAEFDIPAKKQKWSANIAIDVLTQVVNNFVYYAEEYEYDEETYEETVHIRRYDIEGGYYQQADNDLVMVSFDKIDGMPTPETRVRMNFIPFDDVEDYGYSPYEWYDVEF